jgi:hypothetical protein
MTVLTMGNEKILVPELHHPFGRKTMTQRSKFQILSGILARNLAIFELI